MRKLMLIAGFFYATFAAKSQNIKVEGTAPDLYITHIVAPKENFYSVGRLYNQAPKAIAALNKITMEKGLVVGQHVKIPLNAQNFDGSGNAASGESLIPLTHIVAKNENLFKIGTKFNVTAQSLRQWNSLSSDNIAPASPLIVGYLKMQPNAGTAKVNKPSPAVGETNAKKEIAPEPKKEIAEKEKAPENKEARVREKKEVPEKKEVAEVKKEDPFASVSSASTTRKETSAEESPKNENTGKKASKEERIEVVEPLAEAPVKPDEPKHAGKAEPPKTDAASSIAGSPVEGAFATNYTDEASQKSLSTKSGQAATFKSTSGWQDKKYYVLMNDVTPGTILKISSAENKAVYAKVLGSMPEMKENNGLLLRISNAAASYLGIIDPKFPVQVSFYQ